MFDRLKRLEEALADAPGRSMDENRAILSRLIEEHPEDPAPHLAMVLVTSFGRTDHLDAKEQLAAAESLLRRMDTRSDPELAFGQAMLDFFKAESALVQGQIAGPGASATRIRSYVKAAKASRKALKAMGATMRRLRGAPSIARVLFQAMRAHSRARSLKSTDYRMGMRALSQLRRDRKCGRLAGFFQMYGYRRAGQYRQAVAVGKRLERRYPRSSMIKSMIGSSLGFKGDYKGAVKYHKQAVALAPTDPARQLCLARAYQRVGNFKAASGTLGKASRLLTTEKARKAARKISQQIEFGQQIREAGLIS